MLNQRLTAARQVRAELAPAEEAADESYLTALKLGVAMVEARRTAAVSIHTGADCFEQVHAAIDLAGQTRSRLLKAHQLFSDLQQQILPGVSPRMIGDVGGCPPAGLGSAAVQPATLRIAG
jgi:hypothetical protein